MLSYVPTILPQPPPERLQVGLVQVGNGKVLKNQSSSINRKSDKPATLAFKVKNILTELTETEKVTSQNIGISSTAMAWRTTSTKPRPRRPRKKFKENSSNDTGNAENSPAYLVASMSGKDRLLAIIAAEKAASETALKASEKLASEAASATASTASAFEDKISCASTETTETSEQHGSLLRRGVATLRRSFRKAIPKNAKFMNKKLNPADVSHDSGLGEESDTSHPCVSPVTSLNKFGQVWASPVTTPTPILRTTRSFSNDSQQPVNVNGFNKHVMIREPSLRHLPSALRNSFPGAAPPSKPQLVRLETAKHRQYRYSYHADNLTGDVGPQWNNLYFRAGQEVKLLCLASGGCDRARKSDICDLIFSNNSRAIEDKLMLMQAKEVDETIHLLYKILYYDWLEGAVSVQLSIILHCVQKFLIIVVDVCPDLEPNDRRRLAICSRGLLRQSEEARYAPITESLARTRTFYIQVWCALLCVPFAVD